MSVRSLVVVGSVNADLVLRVDRHPAPGETVLGSDARRYPGGKGANQAVAAALLGADVAFVGRVGADGEGAMLADALRTSGVSTGTLGVDAERPSGVALIVVDASGENTIVVSPGANHGLEPTDVAAGLDALGPISTVVLQCELLPDTVAHTARAAAARGARVVLNLAPPTSLDSDVLALADPLVVNIHEAAYLLGEQPGADAVTRLGGLGAISAVVTLGARGAVAGDAQQVSRHPAPQVEVVDTTGAGDAFTGALATRLAEGADLHDATRFAVLAGTAAVRAAGAQSSFPARKDLEEV